MNKPIWAGEGESGYDDGRREERSQKGEKINHKNYDKSYCYHFTPVAHIVRKKSERVPVSRP